MRVMRDLTVGALASRTGLTVRTLHHYDSIALLSPSGRTEAGYRLYSEADVHRLERIVLLRRVGVSLADIATALSQGTDDLLSLLERQAVDVRQQIEDVTLIAERLDHMAERLRTHPHQSVDDAFDTIQAVTRFERYFDREQMNDIRDRARELGEDRIREAEREWPRLIAAVRHEMKSGTAPSDARVLALARRWQELVDEFVNGRFEIAAGAGRMMQAEPAVRQRTGLDAEIMDYVAEATAQLPH
jgi:DNA-binding transcriptional MerR regulator